MQIHQSQLSSYARCPQAFFLENQGLPRKQLSATAYGTVGHYALLNVFEQAYRTGTPYAQALEEARGTFAFYWQPKNIGQITEPVDRWLPRQTYAGLLASGLAAINWYAELMRDSDEELLATEYSAQVPIEGTWDEELNEPHVLVLTVDKLVFEYKARFPVLKIADLKFGKTPTYLRQSVQFSSYAYATTRLEFWTGWRGEDGFGAERGTELYERFKPMSRRGEWISLKELKVMDAGWRGPKDYARFALAVEQLTAAMKADIYPLSIGGENCHYCSMSNVCAGTGVPEENHGAPGTRS